MKRIYLSAALLGTMAGMHANTVLFSENFDDGSEWQVNFPTLIDVDHNHPANNIFPLFNDASGAARPWWKLKDSSESSDGFLGSHSVYTPEGKSNDWAVSRPIEIESEGFKLTFGAQSVPFRTGDIRLSNLSVFISDNPVTESELPSEAVLEIENVPLGKSDYGAEDDFTYYTVNLDKWAGKTIYICFANFNDDRDLLIIDDVKVERLDAAELEITDNSEMFGENSYISGGKLEVNARVNVTAAEGLKNWKLSLVVNGEERESIDGESILQGDRIENKFEIDLEADKTIDYNVVLSGKNVAQDVVKGNEVTALGFRPYRRVLVEEATGMWCGNCPTGIYNMESLSENEETREYAIPVSVHVAGNGSDYLVDLTYSGMLGITAAPAYRVNRDLVVRYFSTAIDTDVFDPSRPNSMANLVRQNHEALTVLDMDMEAEYVVAGNDTTAVTCRVSLTPAATIDTSRYRIGIAMKENNVHAGGISPLMMQHNYLSGVASLPTTVGGWTKMPSVVLDMHYNDVARGVWNFNGLSDSMPEMIAYGDTYKFEHTVNIPDVYYEESSNGTTYVGSPAIKTDFVTMIAYVVDLETRGIVNAVSVPMSEIASYHYDNTGYFSGSEAIMIDSEEASQPEYYTLDGLRVDRPVKGIYIVKRGMKVSKEIFR